MSPEVQARRRAAVPAVTYPTELPIADRVEEIRAAIDAHQVVIVAGETGSGKSTQLPKICLDLGRGVAGMIGHTQPRRLAARTVAERIAEEIGGEIGGPVGYAVRFTDRIGEDTLVKVMTDGILLAEIQRDRMLSRYDTLIVDEAHERSLNVDFILGYLKQLLPRRPDLKVVVTSATIDTGRFSEHFDEAPVVEVSGRTYPVELRYRPLTETDGDVDQTQAVCSAVSELTGEGPGDILVFLSGEREIRDTADAIRALNLRGTEVVPLYARLSAAEQHRVFSGHRGRRVVLATNVAETSLTVPGIHYVVDAGTARISRYNRRTKVQRLPIESVSQASANQRAGRCGRVAPGVCIRLYAEDDYAHRPPFTEPEILRTNLASVVLQMTAIGLGDIAAFPFVDPPDRRSIADGVVLLDELGAFEVRERDQIRRLTPLGRRLAQLPLDPRLGRMVLEAESQNCLREVMVIAAGLSIQDPRDRPADKRRAAEVLHRRFDHPDSDFMSYVTLWDYLREQHKALSSNQFRRLCRTEFLNYLRVREWQDIYSQLRRTVARLGMRVGGDSAHPDAVHVALLAGLLSHAGMRDGDGREYRGARATRFLLAGASPVVRRAPRWVVAAELVETNRLWARVAARVEPQWLERAGDHLVERTYGDPRWDRDRVAAVADERVSLFGLPLVAARQVDYGRVDPAEARRLFIAHALVAGEWPGHHRFVVENRRRVEEVRALEDRARRRDLLVDEAVLFDFFDARLGPSVVSGRHFDRWWKKQRATRPALLDFTLDLLIDRDAAGVNPVDLPDVWIQGDLRLDLSYVFAPGAEDDGVTVHIPLVLLGGVGEDGFDWQVPGRRHELVVALLRSTPKSLRRHLVPVADAASAFLAATGPADGPLLPAISREVARLVGARLPERWQPLGLPDHLHVKFRVEDAEGKTVALGRDLGALKAELAEEVRRELAGAEGSLDREGLRAWDFGALPSQVEVVQGGHSATGYPALVDTGDAVAIRTMTSAGEQRRAMWGGVRRLLLLGLGTPGPTDALVRRLGSREEAALAAGPWPSVRHLVAECVECALDDLVVDFGGPPSDVVGFDALAASVRAELPVAAERVVAGVVKILVAHGRIGERLVGLSAAALRPSVEDIDAQLAGLVHPGFVATVGTDRLADIVRYLTAVERRLDKLAGAVAKDQERSRVVQRLEEQYRRAVSTTPPARRTHELLSIRWMLEELRVSLFAQTLGTPTPVSEQRITRALAPHQRSV